jgi:hypothetical protein
MSYIYLHKDYWLEKNRVDPDDIRKIESIELEGRDGSLVTFKNNDSIKFIETRQEIECKEWRMRYLWPNVERIIMAILGGVIGGIIGALITHEFGK